jgi:FMN-dependent NADH-azoreductase
LSRMFEQLENILKTLLQINASLQGELSESTKLADRIVATLLENELDAKHTKRDLSAFPIPHLDQGTFETFAGPEAFLTPAQKTGLALSDALIKELKEADILVLAAPMYNLMIPSTLKSWIDHVSRAGETFRFGEAGPVGLLEGTTAYVAITQGGRFLGTSADLQTSYLKMILGLMGISEIEFVYAQGLALGPQAAAKGLQEAHEKIGKLSTVHFQSA